MTQYMQWRNYGIELWDPAGLGGRRWSSVQTPICKT